MRVKVQLNGRGMTELLRSAGVAAEMQRRAERVADMARSTAPVVSGGYRDSIHTEPALTDRAVGRVVASVPYAVKVEGRWRTLGGALDAAGG